MAWYRKEFLNRVRLESEGAIRVIDDRLRDHDDAQDMRELLRILKNDFKRFAEYTKVIEREGFDEDRNADKKPLPAGGM